jgi:hypothetical protein
LLLLLLVTLLTAGRPREVRAGCNLHPQTIKTYNSTLGVTNRPYAGPGERIDVRLRPCDVASPGLGAADGDHVVTVVFQPPGGTSHAVVLTAAPTCAAIAPQLATCAGQLTGGGVAICMPQAEAGIKRIDRDTIEYLSFRFPTTEARCNGGGNNGKPCAAPTDCSGGTCNPSNGAVTLAGPAVIVVTKPGDPLPCGVATTGCAGQTGLLACIDDFFANDDACGTGVPLGNFPSFTALPYPNPYHLDCFQDGPPCNPTEATVRAAIDGDGNMLLPIHWDGILVRDQGIPSPRLLSLRFKSSSPAMFPFVVPDPVFLGSFTPEGGPLAPIFEAQVDPTAPDPDVATFFGSVDAPYTVLRVANHHGTCDGGPRDGQRCSAARDCPHGSCTSSCVNSPTTFPCSADIDCPAGPNQRCGHLFNYDTFGFLPLSRTGSPGFCQLTHAACMPGGCPGDLCVSYAFEAKAPVTLDSLVTGTADVRALTVNESVDLRDRNGDILANAPVVTLRSRVTGQGEPLGAPPPMAVTVPGGTASCGLTGTPEGRGVVRVSDPPFRFPAVAVENDVMAFLESEGLQNACSENDDYDAADAILRVFRLGAGALTISPLPGSPLVPPAVDAALEIDHASLAISNGRVFYRASEAAMARRKTERVSVATGGTQVNGFSSAPFVTADGRLVVFSSAATNVVAGDTNTKGDVFLHDRATVTTTRVSVATGGGEGDLDSYASAVSGDGRYVLFASDATNLLAGDTNARTDMFVRDRTMGTTTRVSVATGGAEGNDSSLGGSISDDGRFVAFPSFATNLVAGDTNGFLDIFVRDRLMATTQRVSVSTLGAEADTDSFTPTISANGRFVAWESNATTLVAGDLNGVTDVFVHDLVSGTTERASVSTGGVEGNNNSRTPALSADGRYVAFWSFASNLVPGDTNGTPDAFVHDRVTGRTERVSVTSGGGQLDPASFAEVVSISPDGRYVSFETSGANMVQRDTSGWRDFFVHDRLTGTTERVSVATNGTQAGNHSDTSATISADGRAVAFQSLATNLVASDTNATSDIFVRGLDLADPLGVDTNLFADGALDDDVLQVFDTNSSTLTTLCPAGAVSVADGMAAFLRPESAGGTASCPAGSLNGPTDVDQDDLVVHLWTGGPTATNLGRAATAVSLSPTWLGALVSENAGGTKYSNLAYGPYTVAQLHPAGAGTWTDLSQAADVIEMAGAAAVFITPEAAQNAILNGDGDMNDRVLQIAYAPGAAPTPPAPTPSPMVNTGQAAEEFVVGARTTTACGDHQLVAFRTNEHAQNDAVLNGGTGTPPDTDPDDDVLQVYDLVTGELRNTGQAVTPCRLDSCDPRRPYRVDGGKLRFLTLEQDQGGQDLDGDGNGTGLVLQIYDFCGDTVTTVGRVKTDASQDPLGGTDEGIVYVASAGRCELGTICNPTLNTCTAGFSCNRDTCDLTTHLCIGRPSVACPMGDADCSRCTSLQPSTCLSNADCLDGTTCVPQSVVIAEDGVVDTDDDGIADAEDDCPTMPNTDQSDLDDDGLGDVCDPETVLGCTAGPKPGCIAAAKGQIQYSEKTMGKEQLKAQLKAFATATSAGDFGDPVSGALRVSFCIYDEGSALLHGFVVNRGAALCGGKPCWKAKGTKGWGYQDKASSAAGIAKIGFGSGDVDKGVASVAGKNNAGKGLTGLPTGVVAMLAAHPLPTIQLQTSDGFCVGATMTDVTKNDGGQYKAQKK